MVSTGSPIQMIEHLAALINFMAKTGVTQFDSLGRFSSSPTLPLSPPEIGFNSECLLTIGVEAQDYFF